MRIFLKRLLLFIGVLIVVLVLWQGPLISKILRFNPAVWPALWPMLQGKPESAAKATLQDVRFLRHLAEYDRSYSPEAQQAFHTYLDGVEARAATLDLAGLYLVTARAAALANNGHTGVGSAYLAQHFNYIGLRFYWFGDELRVVRARSEHAALLGAKVQAVEGRSLAMTSAALHPYFGGVLPWRQLRLLALLESPELMHAAGLAASAKALKLDLILADGTATSVALPALPAPRPDFYPAKRISRRPSLSLLPSAIGTEGQAWRNSLQPLDPKSIALYLRHADQPFVSAPLPSGHYLQINQVLDAEALTLAGFIDSALAGHASASLDTLVLDWRWNSGGNFTKMVPLIPKILRPLRPNGKLYLLVGPQTFSAAIVTVAMLKVHAKPRTVLVGEPMGDAGMFWAETGLPFRLPNSRLGINYATGYHDWLQGCEQHQFCFTETIKHGVKAGSLEPDVLLPLRHDDYLAGRDGLMEWVLAEAKNANRKPNQ